MAKITAYTDTKGRVFKTPEEAAKSDIAALFGGDNNIALANQLLEHRAALEAIWAEYDNSKKPDVQIGMNIGHGLLVGDSGHAAT